MKILYAAGNSINSGIQLSRFVHYFPTDEHQVKIAAYKKSSPKNIYIDWTLDCLLDVFHPDLEIPSLENEHFYFYLDQIKVFAPDLIISDLDFFTTSAANIIRIPVWQYGSSLLNISIDEPPKYKTAVNKQYGFVTKYGRDVGQKIQNLSLISDRNLVYSHLGDVEGCKIKPNFEWVRPYSRIGKKSAVCHHNLMAVLLNNNKKTIISLQKYKDVVMFSPLYQETYHQIISKNIDDHDEYFCNLFNCNLFICEGYTDFLADAFYNKKFCAVFPNFWEPECLIGSLINEYLKLSCNVYHISEPLNKLPQQVQATTSQLKFLHEKIKEL